MSGWTKEELTRVGNATQLQLAPTQRDGTLHPYTTMWVVRVADDLYVRSAGGPDRPWYRRATASGRGRIRACDLEVDVTFDRATDAPHAAIDAAYHAKYDRYGSGPVGHVTGADAHAVTVRLVRSDT